MSRSTGITVLVKGEPVSDALDFEVIHGPGKFRRYRATYLTREFYYSDGNWTPQRWNGVGTIVKKDGTLGAATTLYLPWSFEPDVETARQFAVTARRQLRRACDLQGRIA